MRFNTLHIHHLGPFSDTTVDLSAIDGTLVAVTGENGAGKSTFLELLGAALYRSTATRGSLKDLATARDSYVEATVTNGQTYTIRHEVDAISGTGESLVLRDGKPQYGTTKVRDFDVWSRQHLPAPEVLYASTFAAQGTPGFIDLPEADRKSVLLRTLGIDHYERMLVVARKRLAAARQESEVLTARVKDERARGGDVDEATAALAEAKHAELLADEAAAAARTVLADAERVWSEWQAAYKAEGDRRDRHHAAVARHTQARARLLDLDTRIANNRQALAERGAIDDAVTRVAELTTAIEAIDREIADATFRGDAAHQRAGARHRAAETAAMSAGAARERARRARARLAGREKIARAVEALPTLREDAAQVVRLVAEARQALDALLAQRVDGADARIGHLRGGLAAVVREPHHGAQHARTAVDEDDARVRLAAELPRQTTEARANLQTAENMAKEHASLVTAAEQLAARAVELDAAEADAQAADADAETHASAASHETAAGEDARRAGAEQAARRALATAARAVAVKARDAAAPLAAKAQHLAAAEARLAELLPQREATEAEAGAAWQEAAELDVDPGQQGGQGDPAPMLGRARAGAAEADRAARERHAAVAVAEAAVARAQAAAGRLAELWAQTTALLDDLADYARIVESLEGVKQIEVDSAGPELTALVNDLLHTCVGPRWSVTIETQRPGSKPGQVIECCQVSVLDTEAGRVGEAGTFSGGERVLVGEAVSLALSMLACRRIGVEGPTLIRDETGAALSAANGPRYIAMLRRAAQIIGASRVLFVSHTEELQELADARIVVAGGKATVEA